MESFTSNRATHLDFGVVLAQQILARVFQFRRSPSSGGRTSHSSCGLQCPLCQSSHIDRVVAAINAAKPIRFVLPAFPGKSPNLTKVLGPLPDMAERLALKFLQTLCDDIRKIYAPGARILLCSDGRVFSDIVGMRESDVTAYQYELDNMIEEMGLTNISTFNLDELCNENDFACVRRELMRSFGSPLGELREKVVRGSKPLCRREDAEANRMYCGITRFLVEDSTFPGQTKSRTAIQRECKAKAYEVIRRSNAWSELIAERFPKAVRLSIHPQTCGSKKLGIRLVGAESWMTPWHGVAVKTGEDFILLKRSEAEAQGGHLVISSNGRPSHFELLDSASVITQAPEIVEHS